MTAISSGEDWLAQDSKIGFAWSCHVTPFRDVYSRTSWKHPGFRRPPYSHLRQATKRDEGSQRREVYLPQVQTGKTSWISSCSTAATYSKMKSLSWKNVAAEKCCLYFLVLSYFTKSWQEISSTGRGIHVFSIYRWCVFLRRNLHSLRCKTPHRIHKTYLSFSKFNYTLYSNNLISYYVCFIKYHTSYQFILFLDWTQQTHKSYCPLAKHALRYTCPSDLPPRDLEAWRSGSMLHCNPMLVDETTHTGIPWMRICSQIDETLVFNVSTPTM